MLLDDLLAIALLINLLDRHNDLADKILEAAPLDLALNILLGFHLLATYGAENIPLLFVNIHYPTETLLEETIKALKTIFEDKIHYENHNSNDHRSDHNHTCAREELTPSGPGGLINQLVVNVREIC